MPRKILMRPNRIGDAPREEESQRRPRTSTDCTLNVGQRRYDETPEIRSERNHVPSHAHVTAGTHIDLTVGRNSAANSEGLHGAPTTRDGSLDAPSNSGPNEVRHVQFRGLGPDIDPPPDTAVAARVSSISEENVMGSGGPSPDSVQGRDFRLILSETPNRHNAYLDGRAEGARPCEAPRTIYAFGLGEEDVQADAEAQGAVRKAVTCLGAEKVPSVGVREFGSRPEVSCLTETPEKIPQPPTEDPAIGSEALTSDFADGGSTSNMVELEQCVVTVAQDPSTRSLEDPVSENQSPDSVQGRDSCLILPKTPSGGNARLGGCAEGSRSCEVPRKIYAFGLGGKVAQGTGAAHGAVREAIAGLGAAKSPPVSMQQTRVLDCPTKTPEETYRIPTKHSAVELATLISGSVDAGSTEGRGLVGMEQGVVAVAQDPSTRSVEDPVSENQSPDSVQGRDSCLILPKTPSGGNARLGG
ncbi:hypothetical protein PF004_g29954, partial [Phytophthora fragariae]